jgi:hypothetical protein
MANASWCAAETLPSLYITLNTSLATRAAAFDTTFSRIGCHPARMVVTRHEYGSVVGIFRSHVHALRHFAAWDPPAPMYMVFEDDAQPTSYYSQAAMREVVDELMSVSGDFDLAYTGSINTGFDLIWYGAAWHRVTSHTIRHAWSTMHGIIYSDRGVRNLLPMLEARLAELEAGAEPEHVDLFLERRANAGAVARLQIVPYMFDQDWTEQTTNTDACSDGCTSAAFHNDHDYLRRGDHVWWSRVAWGESANQPLFYFVFILLLGLIGAAVWACVYYGCYRPRRCCFKSVPLRPSDGGAPPTKAAGGGASEKTPLTTPLTQSTSDEPVGVAARLRRLFR